MKGAEKNVLLNKIDKKMVKKEGTVHFHHYYKRIIQIGEYEDCFQYLY